MNTVDLADPAADQDALFAAFVSPVSTVPDRLAVAANPNFPFERVVEAVKGGPLKAQVARTLVRPNVTEALLDNPAFPLFGLTSHDLLRALVGYLLIGEILGFVDGLQDEVDPRGLEDNTYFLAELEESMRGAGMEDGFRFAARASLQLYTSLLRKQGVEDPFSEGLQSMLLAAYTHIRNEGIDDGALHRFLLGIAPVLVQELQADPNAKVELPRWRTLDWMHRS